MSSPIDDTTSIARQREEPVVITLTGPLTQQAVARLGALIVDGPPTKTVIVDVSDISDFDSAGTAALLALQELAGSGRVLVVGVREAAARLLAIEDLLPTPTPATAAEAGAAARPQLMPGLMMVTPSEGATAAVLHQTLTAALDRGISIVVADLGGYPSMVAEALGAVQMAGRRAEHQGQELVLVNVSPTVAAGLAALGLGTTTHIAGPR